MDLTRLRYFDMVARAGSLSKAARALGVSQPTLTVAMRRLEQELGAVLFDRTRSGVVVTAAGAALRGHTADIFQRVAAAAEDVKHLEEGDVGSFTLGCHESLGAYFLPGFLRRFLVTHPRIDVTLWNGASAAVRDAVLAREVHFGLVVNPLPHPDLVIVKLFRDAYDLFVASAAPRSAAPGGGGSLEEARERLRAGPLIHAERVLQSHELADRLAADGLLPKKILRCGDLELVKSLALAGIGVAMLPRRVAAYGQHGKLRRLHPRLPYVPDTICLLYRADLHRTRGANACKDALVAFGKALDATEP